MLSIVNNYEEELQSIKERKIILKEVKQQTPEICLAGVKACAWNILYIKKQTPEICLAAVNQDGLALSYVKEQTSEICLAAVKQNWNALKLVDARIFLK